MKSLIVFSEEVIIIKALDETCRALGVSRSDFLRVTLRRALCVSSKNEENKTAKPALEPLKAE